MNPNPSFAASPDSTRIAYWQTGTGSPLLLVHGITSTHTTYDELVPHLAENRTVITFDRRGRGDSRDGEGLYDMARESEDVAAVIEATRYDPIDLFAHSYACYLALGATAMMPDRIRRLILYSPGFGYQYPPGALEAVEQAVENGDPDHALEILLTKIVGMPDKEIKFMRSSPAWQDRMNCMNTVPRECRADAAYIPDAEMLSNLKIPVLILSGATNPDSKQAVADRLADLLPNAHLKSLPEQGHAAHHTGPAELTEAIERFLGQSS